MKNGNKWVSREDWYGRLSSESRIRWLDETKFDRLPPSAELLAIVRAEVSGRPGAPDAVPPLTNGSREPADG